MPYPIKRLVHAKPNEGYYITHRYSVDAPTSVAIAYSKHTGVRVEVTQDDSTSLLTARLLAADGSLILYGSSDGNDPESYGFKAIFGGPLPQSDAIDIALQIAQPIFYTV